MYEMMTPARISRRMETPVLAEVMLLAGPKCPHTVCTYVLTYTTITSIDQS
jgi:hypothetical protein